MACNSSFQGLTLRNAQDSKEGFCVTSLISGPQLQQHSSSPTDPTSLIQPDSSEGEAPLGIRKLAKPFNFLSLARELRDIIYSDLITSGDVVILRVSQQLHDEAKEVLHKQKIFRMYLSTPTSAKSHNSWRPSVLAVNNTIQNFNILMYMPPSMLRSPGRLFSSEYDKLTLEYIQSRQDSRDCHLTLITNISFLRTRTLRTRILEFVCTLSNFELVASRIHNSTRNGLPVTSRNVAVMEYMHTETLQ